MTLLGKLLIVFNLLAAGAFVYFATQDWKGRQNITATAVRYKLLIVGLPVDGPETFDPEGETEFHIPMAGAQTTETISKKILDVYFQAAPGGETLGDKTPVPCLVAEVKRVKGKIQKVLAEKGDAEKIALLNEWLIDQSENYEQRRETQDLVNKGNAAALEAKLMALFDAVLAPAPTIEAINALKQEATDLKGNPEKLAKVDDSRAKPIDSSDRKTRMALLLASLDQDPNWQKHIIIVVGLRTYVDAIAAQTLRIRDMSDRLDKLILTDQVAYLKQESDLSTLSRDRTDLANRQSKLKAEKIEQKRKEDDAVGQRLTALATIQKQLEKTKAEVDEMLSAQGKVEAGLFEVQREVAVTLEQVYQLEAQLAARERELLSTYPLPNTP